jgi:hypothetical protein
MISDLNSDYAVGTSDLSDDRDEFQPGEKTVDKNIFQLQASPI